MINNDTEAAEWLYNFCDMSIINDVEYVDLIGDAARTSRFEFANWLIDKIPDIHEKYGQFTKRHNKMNEIGSFIADTCIIRGATVKELDWIVNKFKLTKKDLEESINFATRILKKEKFKKHHSRLTEIVQYIQTK